MTFVYSDPHFGHVNLAEKFTVKDVFGVETKARPFDTAEQMTQTLLQHYREVVQPEDTVWWLGDVCFRPWQGLIDSIASLPGKRYLILGNHDREDVGRYKNMGFTKLRGSWMINNMLFTHYPVHARCLRDGKDVNIHGHIHSYDYGYPYLNVCVEKTNYAPLSFDDLAKRVAQLKKGSPNVST